MLTYFEFLDINFTFILGKRRYDRKQSGYGGQTKPVFHKKVSFISIKLMKTLCLTFAFKSHSAVKSNVFK